MATLPGFNQQHFTGSYGVSFVGNVVKNNWESTFLQTNQEDDLGIDGIIEFLKRGIPIGLLLAVQIKTGPSHARWVGKEIHVDVKRKHLNYWRGCNLPVLLVWVDDSVSPPKAYWGIVEKDLNQSFVPLLPENQFGLHSKGHIISLIRPTGAGQASRLECELLVGKVGAGIRQTAKAYYKDWRDHSRQHGCINPDFGLVEVSLKGWRHITRKSRSSPELAHSFALLPSAKAIIESTSGAQYVRTEADNTGDNFIVVRSYLSLEREINFPHRAPGTVRVIIEEVVKYSLFAFALPLHQAVVSTRHRFLTVHEYPLRNRINSLANNT